MRLVTFSDGKATRIGALQGDAVLDITAADSLGPFRCVCGCMCVCVCVRLCV